MPGAYKTGNEVFDNDGKVQEPDFRENSLLKLEEVVHIQFPTPIQDCHVKELMKVMAANGYSIRAKKEVNVDADPLDEGDSEYRELSDKITASLTKIGTYIMHSINFGTTPVEGGGNLFTGFRFFTPPGYDLSELRPEEVEDMRNVRGLVDQYFRRKEEQGY